MKLTNNLISQIAKILNETYSNSYIGNITLVSPNDFLFIFSKDRKKKLFISLYANNPALYLIEDDLTVSTIENKDNEWLRKYVKDGYVVSISQYNEDRIIDIKFIQTDEYFLKSTKHLLIELIPTATNMILVDEDGVIEQATRYKQEDSPRPVVKGQKYIARKKNELTLTDEISFQEYNKNGIEEYNNALLRRRKAKSSPVLSLLKSKLKTAEKTKSLMEEKINNQENIEDLMDFANLLLTYQNNEEELNRLIKENEKNYDKNLNAVENANVLFKKYRKLKNEIKAFDHELVRVNDEIEEYKQEINIFPYLNEEEINDIALKFHFKTSANRNKKERKALFYYVNAKEGRICFGKNSKQNEYLTHKWANKEYVFVHIAGLSGSHVIICNDNPSEKQFEIASSIALLLSGQEDGSVHYTQVKNIKKGEKEGQVILRNYNEKRINKIDPSTKLVLNNMKPYYKN
ncbi:MAG: NFACT RNA binding domain-containing protein [Coprobacillus sp.]|nr:NFACT RNA binding domain-containing protein [Coprobacillus sp.]